MNAERAKLVIKKMGIDTYREPVVFLRKDSDIVKAEGFEAKARVRVSVDHHHIVATLNMVDDRLLLKGEAGLSDYAWHLLNPNEGGEVFITHMDPLASMSDVRAKIYGKMLMTDAFDRIVHDIVKGRFSDIDISAFLSACAGNRLNLNEIISLTKSMVEVGHQMNWHHDLVVDKHCVGGLPGNRTTLIVVPIVAAFGLKIPKTSSRAITSSAGTADTMEVLAPVNLTFDQMKTVVEKEGGCIVSGENMDLSPADDILIRVEKVLDLDSEGQLIASVLSKKIAAGSTHVVIDIPVGKTAKVRTEEDAELLKGYLESVGKALGLTVKVLFSDGAQPVGCGIGPVLEARDVLQVLKCHPDAPLDLRQRALTLAGQILEFSEHVEKGCGQLEAEAILNSGKAYEKFKAICDAQGGMKELQYAKFTYPVLAKHSGKIVKIDNRRIAKVAKLAGAPKAKVAGVDLHYHVDDFVKDGDRLFTLHAESLGELNYALNYIESDGEIVRINEG